jgi:hypothetical protein
MTRAFNAYSTSGFRLRGQPQRSRFFEMKFQGAAPNPHEFVMPKRERLSGRKFVAEYRLEPPEQAKLYPCSTGVPLAFPTGPN